MEKRSRRRIRDLVALAAFQGLSQNEIGCARISMMARSTNAPFKGRIQKRKTNHLQIITFGLQRTAGPYKGAKRRSGAFRARSAKPTIPSLDHGAVDEVLEQMPALHAGRGTLCQLDGDQFFFGVYGEAGSEYAAPHCIAL